MYFTVSTNLDSEIVKHLENNGPSTLQQIVDAMHRQFAPKIKTDELLFAVLDAMVDCMSRWDIQRCEDDSLTNPLNCLWMATED